MRYEQYGRYPCPSDKLPVCLQLHPYMAGLSVVQDIGEALHIEVGTVKNHVHSILKKLGVANRQQAAKLHEQQEA